MCNLAHTRNMPGRSKVHFKTKKSKNPIQRNFIGRKFPIHFIYWLFPQIFNANCTGIWIRLKRKITIRNIWLRWITPQRPPLGPRRATFDGRIVFIMVGCDVAFSDGWDSDYFGCMNGLNGCRRGEKGVTSFQKRTLYAKAVITVMGRTLCWSSYRFIFIG